MRTGRRDIRPAWGLAFLAAFAAAAHSAARLGSSGPPVRMTVEVDWEVPPLPALPTSARPSNPSSTATPTAEVSLSEGRIVEVQAGPGSTAQARANGCWLAGSGWKGRARVRLEAPLGSDFVVKVAGQTTRISLAALLEGPIRTPPRSGVEVGVERLPWDSIEVAPGEPAGDGTVEPGAMVPLSVAFNVLTPEPAEVNLHCLAELRPIRGGDPIWRGEWQEVVATDAIEPARHPLSVSARGPEGTYLLEVKTSWEPLGDAAGTRLGRWVRRRRNPSQTTSSTRRLTLAILGPQPSAAPSPSKAEGPMAGVEVDAIDLARSRGHRPSASGRSSLDSPGRTSWTVPEMALVDPSLRDRLRGWINRTLADPPTLAPADSSGLAWSAVGLRVAHPERPHRLTLTISGGHPASLGVAMVAGGGPGGRGRVVLDACVSGPPILEGGPPATYSWPVWPDSEAPVLVLLNRGVSAPVQLGSITLTELAELPAAPASTPSGRSIGLHLAGPRSLDRFGGWDDSGRVDPLAQSRNLAVYLAHCGASTVVLPEGLADRSRRSGLQGQADEDSIGPDRLDLLLRVLARRGATAWVDVAFEGAMPGLPAPDSPEAAFEGVIRLDRRGLLDGPGSYQPIHPRVREAMARKVAEAIAPRKARANLAGVLIRLGPGSTLPGGPDMGLDDATFARFVAAAFEPRSAARVPGQGSSDPARFEVRARYVEAAGRLPWLAWRAKEVASIYSGLALAARQAAPGATLAVVTPGLEPGPAGDEARRVDLAGLGPGHGWRGVGLDLALAEWPTGDGAPVIFRGGGLSTDDLGHDLATSPELDELVAARPTRGVLLGVEACDRDPSLARAVGPRLTACPMADGPSGDEPLGHALAALDPRRVMISSTSVAGQEERIRRFARVFASLPPSPTGPAVSRLPSGVVARSIRSGVDTYLALANDTPYPILLETVLQGASNAPVTDLGRGIELDPERPVGQIRLVLELAPHGVSAIRIGSPEAELASTTLYPTPAVEAGMKAQYDDLHLALMRLDRLPSGEGGGGLSRSGPTNSGFEPDPVQLASSRGLAGWEFAGETGAVELDRDRPHLGRGSLRLDAPGGPASVVSDPFRPEGRSALTIRASFRSDRPDSRVRVRIDGQAAGRPYARQLDVAVRGEWAESVIRASQLPDGGLDSARLRFELLGAGRLWVDDVSVVGDALGESERLNARRDLTAALSAYREKRYADFARLGGSHWARHAATSPTAAVAGDRSGVIRTGEARPDSFFKLNR